MLDLNHDFMLKQMAGTKLDVSKFLARGTSATSAGAVVTLPGAQPVSAGGATAS